MRNFHTPVLTDEVLEFLKIKKGSWYIDCTVGGGGHSEKILQQGGNVLGLDVDKEAIEESKNRLKNHKGLVLEHNNYAYVEQIVNKLNISPINGVLFDLGVSSHQLVSVNRGFSFLQDAPLDMRMNQNAQIPSAANLINGLHEKELSKLFWKLGEEKLAKMITKKIIGYRENKKLETTKELADLIVSIKPRKLQDRIHPATQVFQALRIAVNDELNNLKVGLSSALNVLGSGGRVVVISFHSLEDKIVKDFFKGMEKDGKLKIITKKPVTAREQEILKNPRSRSAKLRAAEKLR